MQHMRSSIYVFSIQNQILRGHILSKVDSSNQQCQNASSWKAIALLVGYSCCASYDRRAKNVNIQQWKAGLCYRIYEDLLYSIIINIIHMVGQ